MRLGAYQILVGLGRGGMADLHIARAHDDGKIVMLKTLRPPATEKRVAMFLDEARLALLFQHPNVVRAFHAEPDQGRYFIAMEYLDGQPLDRILHRLSCIERIERTVAGGRTFLLWILAESLAGLHYAHELSADGRPLNIVHRDFTPENIFVMYDGSVKVLDFGIAKSAGRLALSTTTGEVKGKLRYMAPEQALGLRVDRRADIFGAGVVLFELCSGTSFWRKGLQDRDVFDELVGGVYPLAVPDETGAVNAILARALARDASERYRTAEEMRSDLLEEIVRAGPLESLHARTATFVSELFADQRDRSATMIAAATKQRDAR